MSAETYEALTDAIAAHIADTCDDTPLLTDWYLVAACVGGEADYTGYVHASSNAPSHSLAGLLHIGINRFDQDRD